MVLTDVKRLSIVLSLISQFHSKLNFGCGTKQPILKRDKTADFQNETKQPIFKTGQNSQFLKRDKTADFQNGTK